MAYYSHPTAVIDEGCLIGDDVKIWHFSHLMSGCRIGARSVLGQNVFIASNVVIGNNVHVQNNVSVFEGVECADDVFLGPSMVFTNVRNPRSALNRKDQFQKTYVGKGATIGANATVVCGNRIGSYAMVGAGAVITKDIADYALVVGNPAMQMGWISEHGHRLHFDGQGRAVCSESGFAYIFTEGRVKRAS